MVYKVNEFIYLIKDKYTFKEQIFLDNNKLVYCLVAIKDDVVHGLFQSFFSPTKDEADEAIKGYLKNKRRLVNFDYKNVKELVEITSYKTSNK